MSLSLIQIMRILLAKNPNYFADNAKIRQVLLKDLAWWVNFYADDLPSHQKISDDLSQIAALIDGPFPQENIDLFKNCVEELFEIRKLTTLGQAWFLNKMQACGYHAHKGHCYGISHMGISAFLSDELEKFNERLRRLKNIPTDHFNQHMEYYKKISIQFREEGKIEESKRVNDEMLDFLGFFDGVSLHQNPEYYHISFLQDGSITLPFTRSVTADANQTTPQKIQSFCGAYTLDELKVYLDLLKQTLGDHPFSLGLDCAKHSVNLNYHPRTTRWTLIDSNHLPAEDYLETSTLSYQLLMESFNVFAGPKPEGLVLFTTLYASISHKTELKHNMEKLQNNEA